MCFGRRSKDDDDIVPTPRKVNDKLDPKRSGACPKYFPDSPLVVTCYSERRLFLFLSTIMPEWRGDEGGGETGRGEAERQKVEIPPLLFRARATRYTVENHRMTHC